MEKLIKILNDLHPEIDFENNDSLTFSRAKKTKRPSCFAREKSISGEINSFTLSLPTLVLLIFPEE